MYCYVFDIDGSRGVVVIEEVIQSGKEQPAPTGLIDKLIHLALPVRLTHMRNGGLEMACTYDIHPRGPRLRSTREVKVGDFVTVERGRTKSVCRVVWTADPDSALAGQFTVECVEGSKIPWEEELRQMDEQYLPVVPVGTYRNAIMKSLGKTEPNRRRRPRFNVNGEADLTQIGGESRMGGRLVQLSEFGCLISTNEMIAPGTGLRLVLNMCDVSVALRGHVRYNAQNRAMGIEFQEIRQGDRPLLDYVLNRLKKPRLEDFADLEVITDGLESVAG
jgi:PilZ domain